MGLFLVGNYSVLKDLQDFPFSPPKRTDPRAIKLINEEGVWQDLLKRKYLSNKILTQVKKQLGDSHF
jgi:hypothetical protein